MGRYESPPPIEGPSNYRKVQHTEPDFAFDHDPDNVTEQQPRSSPSPALTPPETKEQCGDFTKYYFVRVEPGVFRKIHPDFWSRPTNKQCRYRLRWTAQRKVFRYRHSLDKLPGYEAGPTTPRKKRDRKRSGERGSSSTDKPFLERSPKSPWTTAAPTPQRSAEMRQ